MVANLIFGALNKYDRSSSTIESLRVIVDYYRCARYAASIGNLFPNVTLRVVIVELVK